MLPYINTSLPFDYYNIKYFFDLDFGLSVWSTPLIRRTSEKHPTIPACGCPLQVWSFGFWCNIYTRVYFFKPMNLTFYMYNSTYQDE